MKAGLEFAWLQVIEKKGHFFAAVSGVAFAVALMFSQIGLRDSLLDGSIRLYSHLRADIVMTNWEYTFQHGPALVPTRRLAQVLSVNDVDSCAPLYIGLCPLKNPETNKRQQIAVIGFHLQDGAWDFSDQGLSLQILAPLDSVIFDSHSRNVYGPLAQLFYAKKHLSLVVANRQVDMVGLVALGPGFGGDGYLFASDATYSELFGENGLVRPTLGLIRLKAGANRQRALLNLRSVLPNDVRFTFFDDFLENEKLYWLHKTPVGLIFTAFLVLGIIVGAVVVYQILYSDVMSHLPEYATMKAMGFANRELFRVIMIQAFYITVLGFIPGALIGKGMYLLLQKTTFLSFAMTFHRLWQVFLLTLTMCMTSGALAMQALRTADPADIF